MGFTEKQQMVVDHRTGSLLVSAAAGSGKTSTLVAHVVKRIRAGGDLNRLIIVTYTKAAAGEMRERIRQALEEAAGREPENRHLRHQLAILGQARISTIDSLCNRLVRSYFQMIDGLTPDIRIAEDAEIRLLAQDIMEAVLEEAYQEGTEDFYALLDGYGSEKNHEDVAAQIFALYDSSWNAPFPEEWLDGALPVLPRTEEELNRTPWMRYHTRKLKEAVRELTKRQDALIRELEAEEALHGAVLAQLRAEREISKGWEAMPAYHPLQKALKDFSPVPLSKKEFKQDPSYEYIKEVRGGLTTGGYFALLTPLRKPPYIGPEEELRLLQLTEAPGRALVALTKRFAEKLGEACRERGIATFMDMEHYALRLLMKKNEDGVVVPTELARELGKGLDEIIVDEYQDINQVQEYILRGLSGEDTGRPNLFMVGDVKQSIYRFRRADPGIFMRKYAEFPQEADAPHRKILLQDNFRSRPAVLEASNRLFSRLMSRDFGGVEYDESVRLNPAGRFEGPDPAPRVLILESPETADKRIREEGRLIACSIRELLKEKRQITEKLPEGGTRLRPLSYGDIVILLRGLKYGAVLSRILKSYGIPAVAQVNKGFYDTAEVQTLLSLLAVLDNPRQDIPLAAVLLSPFGGFSEEELAQALKDGNRPGTDLIDRLKALPPETAGGRFAAFLTKLETWRTAAQIRSVPELLEYLLTESGYGLYLRAMPSGQVRLANLRLLTEMAASYEESTYRGLYQFLRYVERQKDLELDVGEAPLLSDGSDVVRIGTMHSSKGLEYPVVYLAVLGKKFNETDTGLPVLIHAEHGLALTSCDSGSRLRCENLRRSYIAEQIRLEGRAEEMRLFYVGMTRASEQLILVGSLQGEAEEEMRRQAGRPPESCDSYLKWLLQCRAAGDDLGMQWTFIRPDEIPAPEEAAFAGQLARWKAAEEEPDPAARSDLRARMDRPYPYKALPKLSFSVSELKEEAGRTAVRVKKEERRLSDPDAGPDPEALSAAEKGTAFHKLMEHIPPEETESRETVAAYLEKAEARGIFSKAQAAALDPDSVTAFYRQSVGRRARAAAAEGRLKREKPFLLGVPYRELDPEDESGEMALVQGIIDLYFEEEGKLILVDYKTDRVRDPAELIRRYEAQLRWYSRALAAAADRPVTEIYLYSTALKRFIPLPLRDGRKESAVPVDENGKT